MIKHSTEAMKQTLIMHYTEFLEWRNKILLLVFFLMIKHSTEALKHALTMHYTEFLE